MVYLAQELLRTKLPYGRNYFLLLPIAVGTGSAYAITRRNTRICQEMWLAMEEKHSVITPMYGNGLLQSRVVDPSWCCSSLLLLMLVLVVVAGDGGCCGGSLGEGGGLLVNFWLLLCAVLFWLPADMCHCGLTSWLDSLTLVMSLNWSNGILCSAN